MRACGKWRAGTGCLAALLLCAAAHPRRGRQWPAIRPAHAEFTVIFPRSVDWAAPWKTPWDAPFAMYVQDQSGVPAYKLECHSGTAGDVSGFAFSGSYQCALFAIHSGGSLASGDLLAAGTSDESSADWWNRGRIREAQLRGRCLAFPEYSTNRRFRLRGMLLTIRLRRIIWRKQKARRGGPMLARFTLALAVVPDRSARAPRAALPRGPKPPRSCYP